MWVEDQSIAVLAFINQIRSGPDCQSYSQALRLLTRSDGSRGTELDLEVMLPFIDHVPDRRCNELSSQTVIVQVYICQVRTVDAFVLYDDDDNLFLNLLLKIFFRGCCSSRCLIRTSISHNNYNGIENLDIPGSLCV